MTGFGDYPHRDLPDGRRLWVFPFGYGPARLAIARDARDLGMQDEWHYASVADALAVLHEWDGHGEPWGWFRHPSSGRRRPDGDPDREYIRY